MNNKKVLIFIITIFVCLSNCAQAGSIWAKRSRDMRNLYIDDVARSIGDVLTIQISEVSKIDKKAKRDLNKITNRSTDFDGELGIKTDGHNLLPRMPGITMTANSSNKLNGQADYKDERTFTDDITVVVVDILPNGNLVVMGTHNRDIAGDKQVVEVSGIVRPSDISFANKIDSSRVANFRIVSNNEGGSEGYNKPGWLGGIFDFLWPF
jgi:flagellar L-ring protein FlgH